MSNQKWEVGPAKLVNGMDATILLFDEIRKVYLGAYRLPGGGLYAFEWWEDGRPMDNNKNFNLAPPPKKTLRVRLWLNVYDGAIPHMHGTRKQADEEAGRHRFACIEIDREVEEGEGLEPNVRSDAANMRRAKR